MVLACMHFFQSVQMSRVRGPGIMWDAKERILSWSSGGRVGKRGNVWGGRGGGRSAGVGGGRDDEQDGNEDADVMIELNCMWPAWLRIVVVV